MQYFFLGSTIVFMGIIELFQARTKRQEPYLVGQAGLTSWFLCLISMFSQHS